MVFFALRKTKIMGRGDSYQLQGQGGGDALTSADGASVPPDPNVFWRFLYFPEDTVLTNLEGNIRGIDNLEGITHLAGTGFGGQFTAIEVSSGTVIAYTE